jgi:hypothetical protein
MNSLNKDQNILDIVTALNREFRYNRSFVELLHKVDADAAKRIGQAYVEWIYRMLEAEHEKTLERTDE